MRERIIQFEHHPGEEFVVRIRSPRMEGISDETRSHVYAARKELLLSLRSMIDRAVERIGEAEKPKEGKTKIEVE